MKESDFIIGMDIGESSVSVCRYNAALKKPEIIDISGGYAKACVSSVIQYIPMSDEWIIGERERLQGDEVVFDILDESISFDYKGKKLGMCEILSMFIKILFEQMKNIDPNAEIKRVVFTCRHELRKKIQSAFDLIGACAEYSNKYECIIRAFAKDKAKFSIVDYSYSGLSVCCFEKRENSYEIIRKENFPDFSLKKLDESINVLFTRYFAEGIGRTPTEQEKEKLKIFTYNHKDAAFVKPDIKSFRLYYSFCYPPFQKKADFSDIQPLIEPAVEKLNEIFKYDEDYVLTGGGFEQPWAKRIFKNSFVPECGAKAAYACGACIKCAEKEGECREENISISEKSFAIGVMGDAFIKLVDRDIKKSSRFFIVDKLEEKFIDIFDGSGNIVSRLDMSDCGNIKRIKLTMQTDNDNLYVCVRDAGFGELLPSSGYEKKFKIALKAY